jgi:hypothetical protein
LFWMKFKYLILSLLANTLSCHCCLALLAEANLVVSVLMRFGTTSAAFFYHYAVSKRRVPFIRWRGIISENDGDVNAPLRGRNNSQINTVYSKIPYTNLINTQLCP